MSAAATIGRHLRALRDSWAIESERRRNASPRAETQFLPAALEVIETPPNPLGRWMLWAMIGFVGLALVWSVFARVDVVAVAPGKLIASGRNMLVQAPDGGVVRRIHVRDGQRVRKGQLLVELDPTVAGADAAQAQAALANARIEAARARAILSGLRGGSTLVQLPPGTDPLVARTQQTLADQRVAETRARLGTLEGQAAQARADIAGADAEIRRLSETLPLLQERVRRKGILADKGYSSRIQQLELEQQQVDHARQIDVSRQALARSRASAAGIAEQVALARAEATRGALDELAEAEAEIRQREEELTKTGVRAGFQRLTAPDDGTVQQLAVYTAGAVLKPADPILVIVPRDAVLVVEAQVLNKDVGFVREGQAVSVKLEAFPFTRYGTVPGRLVQISRDAVQDEKLGPVYQARVALDARTIVADGRVTPLGPGMSATAEIRTNSRRVIDFLLSPLERRVREAGRER